MMNHVYEVLAPFLGICNAFALLLALVFLAIGPLRRRFWIILAYVSWELLATAGLTIADVLVHGSAKMDGPTQTLANKWYARFYWTNDVLVDLFRFVLVIVLIYKVSESGKRVSGRLLSALVLLIVFLPFVLFHTTWMPFPTREWYNSTSELLNFGGAIMNLFLWAALIASRNRDPQILMVSAGLGVVVTGSAISLGIRHFLQSTDSDALGFLLMNLTQLAGWAIWCWAFRPVSVAQAEFNRAVPTR